MDLAMPINLHPNLVSKIIPGASCNEGKERGPENRTSLRLLLIGDPYSDHRALETVVVERDPNLASSTASGQKLGPVFRTCCREVSHGSI